MSTPRINVASFHLPLQRPLGTAASTLSERRGFLVSISHEAVRGVGETTPLPGWSESLDRAGRALRSLKTVFSLDDLRGQLDHWNETPAARHGVSEALLDHGARRDGRPLYRALGGPETVHRVPVNGVIGDHEPDETIQAIQNLRDEGFSTLKVKVGVRSVEADRERLEAVEQAVDSGVRLRLDANGSWCPDDVRRLLPVIQRLPLDYLEQPFPPENLTAHADLREELTVALDESVGAYSPDAILDHAAADAVVLKPMVLGGLDRSRSLALQYHENGITPVIGGTVDGAVARLGAVHLLASLPVRVPGGLATGRRLSHDLAENLSQTKEGLYPVPQSPGIGLDPANLVTVAP